MQFRKPLRIMHGLLCFVSVFLTSIASGQVTDGAFTYAVEVNGVTCGYADIRVSSVADADGVYTLLEQKTFTMLSALGSEFNTTIELSCRIDPATGSYRSMTMHARQAELVMDMKVRIEDGTASCSSSLLGVETAVALPDDIVLDNPLYSLHLLRDFERGGMREKTCPTFDVREFTIDTTTFTWGGRETLELAGADHETFIIDTLSHTSGARMRLWLDATNGMILKIRIPPGHTVSLADASVKKRIELANMDETLLVRTNASIPDIHRISYMKVKAVLEPTGQWLTAADLNVPGQRFTGTVTDNLVDGIFEIEHPHYDGAGAPPFPRPRDESLRAFLEPAPFIEADDAVLIAKARELTEGAADSWEAACRLSRWVADNIAYEIPGGATARRTYDMRAGECGAHSILLAAFCRTVGIPARMVWGCMYSPNFGGAFGQHAWTEVHMGPAGWIPVDSTAHEAGFVDSGHIRIGDRTTLSIGLNARSMEVLDYRVASPGDDVASGIGAGAYADYVGRYDPPGGAAPVEVLVAEGRLAIAVPDKPVLTFEDAGNDGRWSCMLSSNLFCTFERDDRDRVVAFRLHQLVRMRRIADPEADEPGLPEHLRPYVGDYRFPGRPEPFTISVDDDRLAAWYDSRQEHVRMDPTGEDGRWTDEYGGNSLTFDRDDAGRINALILEVVNTFQRRSESTDRAAGSTAEDDVEAVLDDFNRAATNADFDAYFACLAPDAVFIGTDARERWTVDELRALLRPAFDQGRGRSHVPRTRHIDFRPDGNVACFDELVDIETLGECRGTGVMVKHDDAWLIAQYSLCVPVPNEIVFDVVDRISAFHDARDDPPVDDQAGDDHASDDDTGIGDALAAYLATASFPDPGPLDRELFADDIEALWSNGRTYRGRASVVRAIEQAQRELGAFESFAATAAGVHVRRRGDVAWVSCRIDMGGTVAATATSAARPFARAVRSTFVFVRQGDRWQMTQEHSNPVSSDGPGTAGS